MTAPGVLYLDELRARRERKRTAAPAEPQPGILDRVGDACCGGRGYSDGAGRRWCFVCVARWALATESWYAGELDQQPEPPRFLAAEMAEKAALQAARLDPVKALFGEEA